MELGCKNSFQCKMETDGKRSGVGWVLGVSSCTLALVPTNVRGRPSAQI